MVKWTRSATYLVALGIGLAGCEQHSGQQAQGPVDVSVMVAQHHMVEMTADLPGRVAAFQFASIRPQVSGVILKRMFVQGSDVTKGQQLYQIDPEPYQAAYDRASAALKHGEAELLAAKAKSRRFQQLSKINAVSQQDYDDAASAEAEAQADIASARAEMNAATVNLQYSKVLSPISGRVGRTMFTEGALLTANQPAELTTVTQLDPIYVDLAATGETLARLKEAEGLNGLPARPGAGNITILTDGGTPYRQPGKIDLTEVNIDPGTGTATIRATFENKAAFLLPGMYVHGILGLGQRSAVLVPQNAVMRDVHQDPYVLVVNSKGQLERQSITTDGSRGNNWIVTAGLKDGDRFVTDGLVSAVPGAEAHITHSSPTPEQ